MSARSEFHGLLSCTPQDRDLLQGRLDQAPPATLAGCLRLPEPTGSPLPAVLLLHGSGGLGSSALSWQEELLSWGLASFALDGFSGRGIERTVEDQGVLPQLAMVVDAFRALEQLRRDPRLDPRRIAVIGFSRGGMAALAAGQRRLQALGGLQGAGFAAAVAFYPALWLRLRGDLERDGAPTLVLQGDADDYVGTEQLMGFAAELEAAGRPLELHMLAGAGHVFDGPTYDPPVRRPQAQTLLTAQMLEDGHGDLRNSVSGEIFRWSDPQVGLGATVAHDATAHAASKTLLAEFLGRALDLPLSPPG